MAGGETTTTSRAVVPLFKPFVAPEAADAVAQVLESGYIGDGAVVKQFEKALDLWMGGRILCTNSGTAALWLAYDLAGIEYGDFVIASPMSCLATFAPLAHIGATMLWADCDSKTGLIDVESVEKLIKHYPAKAIISVEYGGKVSELNTLRKLADKYGAWLISDSAHAFGSYHLGDAHATCYSFQAIKTLTTIEGGALSLHRDVQNRFDEARMKRWFGLDRNQGGFRCEQVTPYAGYKFNMVDPNAAVGLANLAHVDKLLTVQRKNGAYYTQEGIGRASQSSSCWLHTINVPDRGVFVDKMAEKGIQCARPHSRCDVHPFLKSVAKLDLPGVNEFDRHHCAIPNGWWVTQEGVELVAKSLHEVLG